MSRGTGAAQPLQRVSHWDLGQATESLQQFFLEPNWAANACLKQILTILIDIWNLISHIGMGQQETQHPFLLWHQSWAQTSRSYTLPTHAPSHHSLAGASQQSTWTTKAYILEWGPLPGWSMSSKIRPSPRSLKFWLKVLPGFPYTMNGKNQWQLIFSTCWEGLTKLPRDLSSTSAMMQQTVWWRDSSSKFSGCGT